MIVSKHLSRNSSSVHEAVRPRVWLARSMPLRSSSKGASSRKATDKAEAALEKAVHEEAEDLFQDEAAKIGFKPAVTIIMAASARSAKMKCLM